MNLEKEAREPKGFREKLVDLTDALNQAMALRIATPEMYKHQMTQIFKTCETLSQKQDAEIARLNEQLAFAKATKKASDRMTSIITSIITAYNRQAVNALKEEYRLRNDLSPDEEVPDEVIHNEVISVDKLDDKEVITESIGDAIREEKAEENKEVKPKSKRSVPRRRVRKK